MTDDLVKRLRQSWDADRSIISQTERWMTERVDAADRIEELTARAERLERENQLQAQEIDKTRRRADKWQSMVIDCDKYLKPGETPRHRMDRDHADVLALMKLLEKEKHRAESAEAKLAKAVEGLRCAIEACDKGRMIPRPGCGIGGMTVEENIRGSIYMGVPAWPIEEARAALAELGEGDDG